MELALQKIIAVANANKNQVNLGTAFKNAMVFVMGSSRIVTPSGKVGGLCPMLSLNWIKSK